VTGAYSPAAPGWLKESLWHHATATAVLVPYAPRVLDLEDIRVTFAEDWSPQIQADLVVPAGYDEDLFEMLDPQKRVKLLIDAGYTYPDGTTDVHRLADLYLLTRPVRRPDNTMALTAASGEAITQGARLDPWTAWVPDRSGLTEFVTWAATYGMYPEAPEIDSVVGAGFGAAELADLPVEAGDDLWSLISEAASRTGAWVYADGNKWIITRSPTSTGTAAHTLTTGPAGTIFNSDSQLSREGFANSCVIRYRWKTGTTDHLLYGYARINGGPYAPEAAGRMGDAQERTGPITQAAANQAAAARLGNLATRGRSLLLEAHAAYWLRPSNTITVQLTTGPPETVLVRSVTYAPLAGTMNVTTRQAINVPMKIGE
jgi:hypothetical protein